MGRSHQALSRSRNRYYQTHHAHRTLFLRHPLRNSAYKGKLLVSAKYHQYTNPFGQQYRIDNKGFII